MCLKSYEFWNVQTVSPSRCGEALDLLPATSPLLEDRDVVWAAVAGSADLPQVPRHGENSRGSSGAVELISLD